MSRRRAVMSSDSSSDGAPAICSSRPARKACVLKVDSDSSDRQEGNIAADDGHKSDHSPSAGGNDDSDDDEVLPPLSARSVIVSPPSARSLRQFDFSTRVMPDVKVGNFTKVYNSYCRDRNERFEDTYGGYDSFIEDENASDTDSADLSESNGSSEDDEPNTSCTPVRNTRSSQRAKKRTPWSAALKQLASIRTRAQSTGQESTSAHSSVSPGSRTPRRSARHGARGNKEAEPSVADTTPRRSKRNRRCITGNKNRSPPQPSSPSPSPSSSSDSEASFYATQRATGLRKRRKVVSSDEEQQARVREEAMEAAARRPSARAQKLKEDKQARRRSQFSQLVAARNQHSSPSAKPIMAKSAHDATGRQDAASGGSTLPTDLQVYHGDGGTLAGDGKEEIEDLAGTQPMQVHRAVFGDFPSQAGGTSWRHVETGPSQPSTLTNCHDKIEDDGDDFQSQAVWDMPLAVAKKNDSNCSLWKPAARHRTKKQAAAGHASTAIEAIPSSSDEGQPRKALRVSSVSDASDDSFVVDDDAGDFNAIEDAPPAVELDMGKAYFAVLDSKRSKRSSKPSAKGGQKAPPKKKVKKPVRHHAATDLSFKDEIDDWDESQGLQTNAKVSAAKAIDHPPRRRHRSTAPMAGRSLIESFPDKMDTNELLEDDKFLAAAIKSGDISAFYTSMDSLDISSLKMMAVSCVGAHLSTPPSTLARRLSKLRYVGLSPLHYAVQCRRQELVKWMLSIGMDVSVRSSVDKEPVISYCRDVACLQLVLDHILAHDSNSSTGYGRDDIDTLLLASSVLKWSHDLRAREAMASTDNVCSLWHVSLSASPASDPPRSEAFVQHDGAVSDTGDSAAESVSKATWCGCAYLQRYESDHGVELVEPAATGLTLLSNCGLLPVSLLADESLVAAACSAANYKSLQYLLERKASTRFYNKEDKTNCYHLAVLSESCAIEGTAVFHSRDKEHDAEGVTSNPDDDPTSTRDDTEKYLFGDDVSASSKHIYTDVQAALCIRLLHQHNTTGLDEADVDGFTPLMRACAAGHWHCAVALLLAGASIDKRDLLGVSPLHLAAAEGRLRCIQALLKVGHIVDCVDNVQWPPLMYADFSADEQCVVELIKADPSQMSILGNLLSRRYECEDVQARTHKIICNILNAIGNCDTYFQLFNDFMARNMYLLDDDCFSFVTQSTGLLNFKNKQALLRQRLDLMNRSPSVGYISIASMEVDREDVLHSAMVEMRSACIHSLSSEFPQVIFKDEAGICTGPKREFLSLLCRDMVQKKHGLFVCYDRNHYMPQPGAIIDMVEPVGGYGNYPRGRASEGRRLEKFRSIGCLLASAIANNFQVDFAMAKPFIKILLDKSLNHPHELRHVDQHLHRSVVEYMMDNPVDGVFDDMTFTCQLTAPVGDTQFEYRLAKNGENVSISDQNKSSYVYRLSKFKLADSIQEELNHFTNGFYEVIPKRFLAPFTPAEFTLMMCGVVHIDVSEWKRNTRYTDLTSSDIVVQWFWDVVESFSAEERSLLLQFSTAQSRLPPGGFAELKGLSGNGFHIVKDYHCDKIPTASTCFNLLKLPSYSSKSQLRQKLLIAVRHGSEGFAFS